MILNEIVEEVCQQCSIDKLNQDNINNLIRWVNMIQYDIASRHSWPWLKTRCIIKTDEDNTTGTVTMVDGSASITGVATTFASTDVGRFIQFSDSNDWYKITAVASTTGLTLEEHYHGDGDTDATITIRTFNYSLPSDLWQIFDVRQFRTPVKLQYVDTFAFDSFAPNQTSTGSPLSYNLWYYNNPQSVTGQEYGITFDPIPAEVMQVEVRYLRKPPELAAGTSISCIPVMFHKTIVEGVKYLAYQFNSDPSTGGQKEVYEEAITVMKRSSKVTLDAVNILRSVDSGGGGIVGQPYPSQYGN